MATLSKAEAAKERARKGQARSMQGRDCPQCGRGNATKKIETEWAVGRRCRYCGWEVVGLIDQPAEDEATYQREIKL